MTRLPPASARDAKWSACGVNASLSSGSPDSKSAPVRVGLGLFPPDLVVEVKALVCEPPALHDLPLSGWSSTDLARHACRLGLVSTLSGSTV